MLWASNSLLKWSVIFWCIFEVGFSWLPNMCGAVVTPFWKLHETEFSTFCRTAVTFGLAYIRGSFFSSLEIPWITLTAAGALFRPLVRFRESLELPLVPIMLWLSELGLLGGESLIFSCKIPTTCFYDRFFLKTFCLIYLRNCCKSTGLVLLNGRARGWGMMWSTCSLLCHRSRKRSASLHLGKAVTDAVSFLTSRCSFSLFIWLRSVQNICYSIWVGSFWTKTLTVFFWQVLLVSQRGCQAPTPYQLPCWWSLVVFRRLSLGRLHSFQSWGCPGYCYWKAYYYLRKEI